MNLRRTASRIVNFVRPQPQRVPVSAAEILGNPRGQDLIAQVNDVFYSSGVAGSLNWRGMQLLKSPTDLWTYVELLQRLRPSAILETGTHHGASAAFFADLLGLLGIPCAVITVDINPKWSIDPAARGIQSIVGYSTDPEVAARARAAVAAAVQRRPGHVLVTLDSDHSEANVSRELELYASLVTPGSYLVVEDTNVNGHPSMPGHGPGPWEAAEKFLAAHPEFTVDLDCQRFLITNNPRGWLRRSA